MIIQIFIEVFARVLAVGNNGSEACMLEEVSSKGISWIYSCFISHWYPGPSLKKIVLIIECWGREIIIYWMDLEAIERIYWCHCPLPDIAH